MDNSAWIGFSILLLVILLLAYVRKASLSHSKKLSKIFNRINRQNQYNVTDIISWDSGIIGIEKEKFKLIAVKENNYIMDQYVIDMFDIKSCKVFHERLSTHTKIDLVIYLKENNTNPIAINFYDSAIDIVANMAELKELAVNMAEIVSKLISNEVSKQVSK